MIINDVENIIEKYCYYTTRESENGDIEIKDELAEYFTAHNLNFKIKEEEGLDTPGYAEDFMAIAFLDENNELQLLTILFEYH